MKNIFRVSSILGTATFLTIITGLVKNKFLALSLGPVGLGVIAQLSSYLNTSNAISSFGMSQAVTKYVAESHDFANRYIHLKKILQSAIGVVLSLGLPICLFTILFSKKLSLVLLNNVTLYTLFVIIAIAVPLQAASQIYISFVQGLKAVKWLASASVFTGILGLVFLFPLVIFLRITGAAFNIVVLAGIGCCAFLYATRRLIRKEMKECHSKEPKADPDYLKKIMNFGYLRFIQSCIFPLTILAVRSLVIRHLGVFSNGIYESACAFSFLYVPLINNILWSYSYPSYCSSKDNATLSKEVNQFLKISIFIAVPMIVGIILFRNMLVRLLFSVEFLPAVALISIVLIGDFLKVLIWPFNVVLMAKDKMKIAVVFELVWNTAFLILSFLMISTYKLRGVFIMQNISLSLILLLSYIYVNKKFSVAITRDNLLLSIVSILVIVIISAFKPII
ncbi:MAG: oligosaccharide flippase family protein [Candidatus Omnitrophota bacterium]